MKCLALYWFPCIFLWFIVVIIMLFVLFSHSSVLCIYWQISGDISFKDVEVHLLRPCREKTDAIRKELLIVCDGDEHCVKERLEQIEQYQRLGAYSRGAETMISIKKMFKLSGDFSPVEMLVDLVRFLQFQIYLKFIIISCKLSMNICWFIILT